MRKASSFVHIFKTAGFKINNYDDISNIRYFQVENHHDFTFLSIAAFFLSWQSFGFYSGKIDFLNILLPYFHCNEERKDDVSIIFSSKLSGALLSSQ